MKTSAWFPAPASPPVGPCCAVRAFGLASALVLMAVVPQTGRAQTRVTLSGTVKDAATGEDLSGATVRLRELPARLLSPLPQMLPARQHRRVALPQVREIPAARPP